MRCLSSIRAREASAKTTTTTGSFMSRRVASSPRTISSPASPTKATTGRSGAASLAPMASGRAQPMVQSPEDCSRVRGAGQRQTWDSRMRWAPLSTVAMPSAGRAWRTWSTTAAGPQSSAAWKASARAALAAAGAPLDQAPLGLAPLDLTWALRAERLAPMSPAKLTLVSCTPWGWGAAVNSTISALAGSQGWHQPWRISIGS